MMKFNKTEREIVRSIVKYGDNAESLANAFNKSHLLEKRGWNIVICDDGKYYLFYRQDKFDYEDEQKVRGYLAELLALLDKLYSERLLVAFPSSYNRPLVIGRDKVKRYKIDVNSVNNGEEYIVLHQYGFGWYNKNKEPLYSWCECTGMVSHFEMQLFSAYHVSQDLIELVKNKFRTEEEIRFTKQQWLTWFSIAIALIIGLLGIFIK